MLVINMCGDIRAFLVAFILTTALTFSGCPLGNDNGDNHPAGADDGFLTLLEQLLSEEWEVRKRAMDTLVERGVESVPYLVDAMNSDNPHLRLRAALVLGWIGPEAGDAVPVLLNGLRDKNSYVRLHSGRALGQIGSNPEKVVPAMIDALDDNNPKVRGYITDALSVFKDEPGVAEALLGMVDDADSDVRYIVAEVLGVIGNGVVTDLLKTLDRGVDSARKTAVNALSIIMQDPKVVHGVYVPLWLEDNLVHQKAGRWNPSREEKVDEVVSALVHLAEDDNPEVRKEVVWALGRINRDGPSVVPVLIESLNDEDWYVKWACIDALSKFGDKPGVVSALINILEGEDEFLRSQATHALMMIGSDASSAVPALISSLKDENTLTRKYAALALGAIGINTENVIYALIDALADEYELTRSSAAYSLGQLDDGTPRVVDLLINALSDESYFVRKNACHALGMLGVNATMVVPALVNALDDEDDFVKLAAIYNIGAFGSEAGNAIPKLRALITEKGSISAAATYGLFMIGDEPERRIESLIEFLGSHNIALQSKATYYLGEIGPEAEEAVPELLKIFNDGKSLIAMSAAEALGKIGPKAQSALSLLNTAANDEEINAWVRLTILEAIAKIEGTTKE